MKDLGPDRARIFRITHIDNVAWILMHGLRCQNDRLRDPNFVPIGDAELIVKRSTHPVPLTPGGSLSDYVSFYFTPKSIMLYNIVTGHRGIMKRNPRDIVILTSSLPRLTDLEIPFVFTTSHAYMQEAEYFSSLEDLDEVDWDILRAVNFKRDPDDPGKMGRYQAEALVHRGLPPKALLGIACYDDVARERVYREVEQRGLETPVKCLPKWYF